MSKFTESAVRKRARRDGYRVMKSRRQVSLDNHGEFTLLDADGNYPVLGFKYDATLDDIADYLGIGARQLSC
jgi:hypothetical protein